ncbi:hypothetical protein Csa_023942, partial [Cucumis sativus]
RERGAVGGEISTLLTLHRRVLISFHRPLLHLKFLSSPRITLIATAPP